jgi:hypothetical protein
MKRSFNRILFVWAVLLPITGLGQAVEKWNAYAVSHTLDLSNLNSKKLFRDKNKAKSLENNIADFYLFKNGIPVKPGGHWNYDFFAAGCLCFRFDDTLLFSSGLGHSAGVGVGLKIYQNQFSSSLHVNSRNALVYKLNMADTNYVDDLTAEPIYQSLKLTQKPSDSNEIMIGEYNGTYKKFYQKSLHSGRVYIRKYRVRIIFKCKITGIDTIKK